MMKILRYELKYLGLCLLYHSVGLAMILHDCRSRVIAKLTDLEQDKLASLGISCHELIHQAWKGVDQSSNLL